MDVSIHTYFMIINVETNSVKVWNESSIRKVKRYFGYAFTVGMYGTRGSILMSKVNA